MIYLFTLFSITSIVSYFACVWKDMGPTGNMPLSLSLYQVPWGSGLKVAYIYTYIVESSLLCFNHEKQGDLYIYKMFFFPNGVFK